MTLTRAEPGRDPPGIVCRVYTSMTHDVTAPAVAPLRSLVSVGDAAAALGIDRATVYRMAGRGEIRLVKLGRLTRIERAEIDRLIDSLPRAMIRYGRHAVPGRPVKMIRRRPPPE